METKKDMDVLGKAMFLTDTLKFRERFLDEMSGGEKQLAVIGRALAQKNYCGN
jgi:iron complex transport system ATP-binding protein